MIHKDNTLKDQMIKIAENKDTTITGTGTLSSVGSGVGLGIGASALKGAYDAKKILGRSPAGRTKREQKGIAKARETIALNDVRNKAIAAHDAVHGSSIGKKIMRTFGRAYRRGQNDRAEKKIRRLLNGEKARKAAYNKKFIRTVGESLKRSGLKGAALGGVLGGSGYIANKLYKRKERK